MRYDYLIVGSGLFGSVFAHEMNKIGKKCLIIEKRNTIGGNIYTEKTEGINVHKYGAHIFHTSNEDIWNYVNQFIKFNRFTNSPIANYKGKLYNLPFNMNTFYGLWGVKTPEEAKKIIEDEKAEYETKNPSNLEEQAINLVGPTIYEILIKGYTEKQWGKPCTQLPSFIIKRLPVRFTFDNNYFNDLYQGIPIGGYTQLIEKLLEDIEVKTNEDYFENKEKWDNIADKILFTGMIDQFFDYCYGELEYRGLNFETEIKDTSNYQGNAVVNYTEAEIPYTRIIEHKHFENSDSEKTIITHEYSKTWKKGDEAYYPVNDDKNSELYSKYEDLSKNYPNILFGGRLGMYKYMNMDEVIKEALQLVEKEK
ncbi:UDP-galactopyranose mutase [Methanosphaera sp.]